MRPAAARATASSEAEKGAPLTILASPLSRARVARSYPSAQARSDGRPRGCADPLHPHGSRGVPSNPDCRHLGERVARGARKEVRCAGRGAPWAALPDARERLDPWWPFCQPAVVPHYGQATGVCGIFESEAPSVFITGRSLTPPDDLRLRVPRASSAASQPEWQVRP